MPDQLSLLTPKSKSRIVYFDLETLRSADDVGGWTHVDKMGLACGVCFDSLDGKYHTYEEKDVQNLIQHLRRAHLVVGFNHIRFDYKVLSAYSTFNLRLHPNKSSWFQRCLQ